jgi:hypothetical protein
MASDAYATGQALYALSVAGKMAVSNPVYQKGIDYLLRTQASDGTGMSRHARFGCSRISRAVFLTAATSSSRRLERRGL